MGYALQAFIGAKDVLEPLLRAYRSARMVPLTDAVSLVPLGEVLRNMIQRQGHDPESEPSWPFSYLSPEGATILAETCEKGMVVYVEAEFFGGAGRQASVGWKEGALRHGPVVARDAINRALRFLGVAPAEGKDEFDTVGLGRHRATHEWEAQKRP